MFDTTAAAGTVLDVATTVVKLIGLTKDARDGLGMAEIIIERFPFKVGRECRTPVNKALVSMERRLRLAPQLNWSSLSCSSIT